MSAIPSRSAWPFFAHLLGAAFVFLGIAIFDLPRLVAADVTSEFQLPSVIAVARYVVLWFTYYGLSLFVLRAFPPSAIAGILYALSSAFLFIWAFQPSTFEMSLGVMRRISSDFEASAMRTRLFAVPAFALVQAAFLFYLVRRHPRSRVA
jgi:hypothetical protein